MIRNITILLLLTFGLVQGQLHHFVEIDQPQLRRAGPCITKQQRERLQSNIRNNMEILISNGELNISTNQERVLFNTPLKNSSNYNAFDSYVIYNYVDQDLNHPGHTQDWNCGNRTYDLAPEECPDDPYTCNHRGTDFVLSPFHWNMMYNNSVEVVAVAEGIIVDKLGNQPDESCGEGDTSEWWNYISIRHHDGTVAVYGHFRTNSLTNKALYDTVYVGEYLGIVGSSGYSFEPHLHFEVWEDYQGGTSLDPFYDIGYVDENMENCNQSNDESLWLNQKPYVDSAILRIMTHSSEPQEQECPQPYITNEKNIFGPGEIVYIGVYHRDHYYGHESQYRVYDQIGDIDTSWIDIFEGYDAYYSGPQFPYIDQDAEGGIYWVESWRIYPLILPADTSAMGDWKIEIDFEGVTYEQSFNVGYTDLLLMSEINISESAGDYDQVINPGESIDIIFNINNFTLLNVVNLSGAIDCVSEDIIINNNIYYNSILSGESITNSDQPFSLSILENIEFGEYDCNINFIYYNELDEEYSIDLLLTLAISMNQFGFPISSTSEIKTSPLVIDLDNDGISEIIFGDKNGFIRIINSDGTEVVDETFPYYTGDQIWGSAAATDMDGDGFTDFVITSKSKHLYIFDQNGLKTNYNANEYLLGTPAIGNLDGDADLEVVVGSYSSPSSSNQIFAINPDGSDVDGFPFTIGEKTKAGVALADFNGNGMDDIIVGTDDDNIYVIFDDGTVAPGFPYNTDDKIQAAPSVMDIGSEKIIFFGSNDSSFYAVNSDGNLRFTIQTGHKVQSSPSFTIINNQPYIFFGSNDGYVYAVDQAGNPLSGWPIDTGSGVESSIAFSDFNNDHVVEIVVANNAGNILCYSIDGTLYPHFPINYYYGFTSSITINDVDMDGDLEILAGNTNSLVVIDVKESTISDNSNYWHTFRGNNRRTGYITIELDQLLGDINGDGIINILDLVIIANMILANDFNVITDMNEDGALNVLDLVLLVNIILEI